MKVLLHSNSPWTPSGYGVQAQLAGRMLIELGHQVSYSAFSGLGGQPITWQVPGIAGRKGQVAVYPSGMVPFAPDMICGHAMLARADVIVSIMDTYKLLPACPQLAQMARRGVPFAPLVVTDSVAANGGPSMADQQVLALSGAIPAAVSQWGQGLLRAMKDQLPDGWDAPWVPHAVDTAIFSPPADRKALRRGHGTEDHFVVGIQAANRDPMRKSFAESFAAFARFSHRHPDARLVVFSVVDSVNGLPLDQLAADMGILDKCEFMPTYEQNSGVLTGEFVAEWHGALDVLLNPSFAEGFGVTPLEALACGTPVIVADNSAQPELGRDHGWVVKSHRFWNASHRGWWGRPDEDGLVKALERAYAARDDEALRARCAAFAASSYGLDAARGHWEGFMGQVQEWKDSHPAEKGEADA
jgi:hypothetical protein